MNEVLANPTVQARFSEMGVEPMPLTPDGFARHIAREADKWAEVIRAKGIQVN
jgi:tripartite-type tricarboxylate transporter receptor subunit TctC